MIMRDFITAKERLNFNQIELSEYENEECAGCGRTAIEIAHEAGCDIDSLDEDSVTTNGGLWYCHTDCLRDSR